MHNLACWSRSPTNQVLKRVPLLLLQMNAIFTHEGLLGIQTAIFDRIPPSFFSVKFSWADYYDA